MLWLARVASQWDKRIFSSPAPPSPSHPLCASTWPLTSPPRVVGTCRSQTRVSMCECLSREKLTPIVPMTLDVPIGVCVLPTVNLFTADCDLLEPPLRRSQRGDSSQGRHGRTATKSMPSRLVWKSEPICASPGPDLLRMRNCRLSEAKSTAGEDYSVRHPG
jgi:hypothetical protein